MKNGPHEPDWTTPMNSLVNRVPSRPLAPRRTAPALLLLAFVAWLVPGCDNGPTGATPSTTAPSTKKLKVAATTTMIGDLVRSVGGDRVDLTVIMPPGTDPHTYKPS